MEGNVNWTTVAISWLFSTLTTLLIVCLAPQVCRRCHNTKRSRTTNSAIQSFGNKEVLEEWNSDKPLKTSSPCPRDHDPTGKQGATRPLIRPEHLSRKIQEKSDKSRQKETWKGPTEVITPLRQQEQSQNHINCGDLHNNTPVPTKEENIFRKSENKTLIAAPPRTISSNDVCKNILMPPVETRSRSMSVHCVHPCRDSTSVAFIKNLKSSPTGKKRQSSERLKAKKDINHTASNGNFVPNMCMDKPQNNSREPQKQIFPSTGHLTIEQATSQRPPRPIKLTSSIPNTNFKGPSIGHFEIRPGSNSPPPTLLPLTASIAANKIARTSHLGSPISKSISSDTIPLRSPSPRAFVEYKIGSNSYAAKTPRPLLPGALSCNSSC